MAGGMKSRLRSVSHAMSSTNMMSLPLIIMGLVVVAAIPGSAAAYGKMDNWSSLISKSSAPLLPLRAGNKVFYLYPFQVNWHGALLFCTIQNTRLASIESQAEQDALMRYVQQFKGLTNTDIWISGTDLVQHGEFVWMGTGQLMTYTNWAANEPNNEDGNEHCVNIHSSDLQQRPAGTWNDLNCDNLAFFACEKSL